MLNKNCVFVTNSKYSYNANRDKKHLDKSALHSSHIFKKSDYADIDVIENL